MAAAASSRVMPSSVPVRTNVLPARAPPAGAASSPGVAAVCRPAASSRLASARCRGSSNHARTEATDEEMAAPAGGPLAGQSFVLTGTLEGLTREQATDAIERLGGKVTSSVSRKTSYVVVGADPGTKADKARQLGIETLDEAALRRLIMPT